MKTMKIFSDEKVDNAFRELYELNNKKTGITLEDVDRKEELRMMCYKALHSPLDLETELLAAWDWTAASGVDKEDERYAYMRWIHWFLQE